jgi:hypothetical protein
MDIKGLDAFKDEQKGTELEMKFLDKLGFKIE